MWLEQALLCVLGNWALSPYTNLIHHGYINREVCAPYRSTVTKTIVWATVPHTLQTALPSHNNCALTGLCWLGGRGCERQRASQVRNDNFLYMELTFR